MVFARLNLKKFFFSLFFVLIAFAISSHTAFAATYYVAGDVGSDIYTSDQAQSTSTPWKTIQKAADTMVAGDTVNVKGNLSYIDNDADGSVIRIGTSGSAGNPITYQSWPGTGIPVIDLQKNSGSFGFYVGSNKKYITINGFKIINPANDQSSWGIMLQQDNQGSVIENNLIVGNFRIGVRVQPTTLANIIVVNNTISGAVNGIDVLFAFSQPYLIKNNIIYNCSVGINAATIFADPDLDYNLLYNNTTNYSGVTPGAHDLTSDPLFTNAGLGNFTLQVISPALGVGTDLSSSGVTTDILGYSRQNRGRGYDLGAYENLNYYVDGSAGSDSNAGTYNSPWETIQKAASTTMAGDTVNVKGGISYFESVSITNSGTSSNYITYQAWPNTGIPIIDAAPSAYCGMGVNCISGDVTVNYIIISGFQFKNSAQNYSYMEIYTDHENYWIIKNNLFTGSGKVYFGIELSFDSQISVYNNTFYNMKNPSNFAEAVDLWSCSDSIYIKNNVFLNGNYGIYNEAGTYTSANIDYNLFYGNATNNYNTAIGSHNISTSDPLLSNPANDNFTPKFNSPAIDAGTDLTSVGVTTDITGFARPQAGAYDIGAYEDGEYYVDQGTGYDENIGSMASPWRTITKAAATLTAGQTVNIKGGYTYTPPNTSGIIPANSGAAGAYITYEGWPGTGIPIIDVTNDYYAFNISKNYINITGLLIKNSVLYGISFTGSNINIYNDILFNNPYGGVIRSDSASNNINILNNIFRQCGYGGVSFGSGTGSYNLVVENNIFYNNSFALKSNSVSLSVTADYNLYYLNTNNYSNITPGAHDLIGDPHFVDLAINDDRLMPYSPAIGNGVDVSSSGVISDIVGNTRVGRGSFDIGPYADTNYYVDGINGNDSSNGSMAHPWLTIQKAANTVTAGGIINIKGGISYTGNNSCSGGNAVACLNVNAGTSNSNIIYQGWPTTGVPIIETAPSHFSFGVREPYLVIRNLKFDGSLTNGTNAIWVSTSSAKHVVYANNILTGFSSTAISIGAGGSNYILNNLSYSNGSGIYAYDTDLLANNIIYNNSNCGLSANHTSANQYNNIGYANRGSWSNNDFCSGPASTDRSVDPMFVNAAIGDMHLMKSSPGINAGIDTSPYDIAYDINYVPRPQGISNDVGPYEYYDIPVTLNALTPNPTNNTTPTLTGTVSTITGATISSISYSVDGGSWTTSGVTGTSSFSITFPAPLAEGIHEVQVKATDSYGNSTDSTLYGTEYVGIDRTGPVGSVEIDNNTDFTDNTTVMLTLDATDNMSLVNQMIVSDDASFAGASWESYVPTKSFTFPSGDGVKEIYVKFNDSLLNVSQIYTASIYYDTTRPTDPSYALFVKANSSTCTSADDCWTNESFPAFRWTEGNDPVAGIKGYCLYFGTDESGDPTLSEGKLGTSPVSTTRTQCNFITGTNSVDLSGTGYLASGLTNSDSFVSAPFTYFLNIKTIDNAGNVSTGETSIKFKYDGVRPSNVGYITIPSGNFSDIRDMHFSWPISGNGVSVDNESGLLGWQYQINSNTGPWKGTSHSSDLDLNYIPLTDSTYQLTDNVDGLSIVNGVNIIYFRTVDNVGNFSTDATVRSANMAYGGQAPTFGGTDSVTVTPGTNTTNSYSLSWPAATATVGKHVTHYYYSINTLPASTLATVQANVGAYFDTGTNLSIDTAALLNVNKGTNTVYVVAIDDSTPPNYSPSSYISGTFILNSTDPDNVGNLVASDSSIKSQAKWNVTLTWIAPVYQGAGNLSYLIYRSTNGTSFTQVGSSNGLSYVDNTPASRLYYYKIVTRDGANALSTGTNTVMITPTGRWTTYALLDSGPTVTDISTRKATISWTTERPSDSKIEYGTTSGHYNPVEASSSIQTAAHSIMLTGLTYSTTYFYRVQWTDEDGNTGTSQEQMFTTNSAPSVKGVVVTAVGTDYALIKFTVTGASSAKIYYGPTTNFGGAQTLSTSPVESTYTAQLTNLNDGTKYYYRINLFDSDGYEYNEMIVDFTTYPRPLISDVNLTEAWGTATNTVNITWHSNTGVSSIVNYYPSTDPSNVKNQVDVTLVSGDHKMTIQGLEPSTRYAFIIKGTDAIGNQAQSDVYMLTTSKDTRPPVISDLAIEGKSNDITAQLVISWNTDEPGTSQVEYSEGTGTTYTQYTSQDSDLTYNHVVIINNLTASKVYHLKAISVDAAGNVGYSSDAVSITPKYTDNALNLVWTNLIKAFGV